MEPDAVTPADFARLETKMDKLGEAVGKLVLVEERQTNQSAAISKNTAAIEILQMAHAKLDARFDRVIYACVGGWSVVLVCFEVARFIFKA